jgi:hypothetical protein
MWPVMSLIVSGVFLVFKRPACWQGLQRKKMDNNGIEPHAALLSLI